MNSTAATVRSEKWKNTNTCWIFQNKGDGKKSNENILWKANGNVQQQNTWL